MTSNSVNMSVAERLADKLKNDSLGHLMDDEMLAKVAEEAIKIGFFKAREQGSGYNRETLPPLVVELAQEAFKDAITERIKPIVDALGESVIFKELMARAITDAIPQIAKQQAFNIASSAMYETQQATIGQLNAIVGGALGIDFNTGQRTR